MQAAAYYRGFEVTKDGDVFVLQSTDEGEEPFALQANSVAFLFERIDEMLDPRRQTPETRPGWLKGWDMTGMLVLEQPPIRPSTSAGMAQLKSLLNTPPGSKKVAGALLGAAAAVEIFEVAGVLQDGFLSFGATALGLL